ncbi:MAG: CDP-diacylglycerol--serine O-phosphatidyltransferase [Gammaproteobacteria bacterium]|nr:CDP-diacylglycerol--serine O-phosphatidyltransferase [Gammaproteobacteria bacterium]
MTRHDQHPSSEEHAVRHLHVGEPDSDSVGDVDPPPRRRGIFLLPNLFTTAALFAGFYAIIAGMRGGFTAAAIAIFIAMVLDGMDGRVARLTGTASSFGEQYDSLADAVSFGIAPALLVYQFALIELADYGSIWGRIGWLVAFFYAVATALRLARFNARAGTQSKRWFLGLPSPSAAGVVAGMVWLASSLSIDRIAFAPAAAAVTVFVGAMMMSNLGYYSFKEVRLDRRVAVSSVLAVPLVFICVTLSPPGVLFGIFFLYALSAPLWWLVRLNRRRLRRSGG